MALHAPDIEHSSHMTLCGFLAEAALGSWIIAKPISQQTIRVKERAQQQVLSRASAANTEWSLRQNPRTDRRVKPALRIAAQSFLWWLLASLVERNPMARSSNENAWPSTMATR
jgi:hypothetical protein